MGTNKAEEKMTREQFIMKYLGNSKINWSEENSDMMRDDLDKVINYHNQKREIDELTKEVERLKGSVRTLCIQHQQLLDKAIDDEITDELTEALTNYFDKYYEGVEKVDRTGLDIDKSINKAIVKLIQGFNSELKHDGKFEYKGCFVMDKHGNIAKPVKEEVKEMFVYLVIKMSNLMINSCFSSKEKAEKYIINSNGYSIMELKVN